MLRKKRLYLAAGLAAALVALLGAYLLRPIHIDDQGRHLRLNGAGRLTVWQALAAAQVTLAEGDQVEPAPGSLLPIDGQVRIRRVVQALLWEDGQSRLVRGYAQSPRALLLENQIRLGEQDRLLWNGLPAGEQTLLPTGKPLVLQLVRARAWVLDENGARREISGSQPTTAQVLWAAGVRSRPGDRVSAAPGSRPETGAVIAYLPARELRIEVLGQQLAARSSASTVGEALAEAGLALNGLDYSQPAEDQPLPADGLIRVTRVREEIRLTETLLPYETEHQPDPDLELDGQRTLRAGQYGVKVVRERARYEDGQQVSQGPDSDWTASEPVAQVIGVGSKVVTKTVDTPDGPVEYWRAVNVYATSYSPCQQGIGRCSWSTSSGVKLTKGVVAVTHAWYRQLGGQRVYIPGYGFGVIGDVGGGIPGTPWIDLGWDEENFQGMVGWMTMYLLTPAPSSIPIDLP